VTAPTVNKVPDFEVEDDNGVFRYYDPANEYTASVLEAAGGTYEVRSEHERFAELGYQYRPDYSFVLQGVRLDGQHTEVAVLALENTATPQRDAIFLYFLRGKNRNFVVPTRLERSETAPDRSFFDMGSGLWFGALDPLWESTRAEYGAARFSWKQWSWCMASGLAESLAGCVAGCSVSPLTFNHCMLACGTAVLIRSLINCTFDQL
jgi:hypothetical protein